MSAAPQTVDVDEVLSGVRMSGLTIGVALLVMLTLVLDGLDIQIIGLAAGAIVADFDVDRRVLAPALAASLVGMAVGAFVFGRLGDRRGRRLGLLSSTCIFGVMTVLGALADSIAMLAVLRFLTGLGLGGALVNGATLLAEFFPRRWRSQAVSFAIIGVPLGGMLGAVLAGVLLPQLGWRPLFVIGGALPLGLGALMYFVIPESPRFLALESTRAPALAKLLNRIEGGARYDAHWSFIARDDGAHADRSGLGAIFAPELRRDSLLAGAIFFASVFAGYSFFHWLPVALTSSGIELATALKAAFVFNAAGVVAALANAWIIARVGSRWPLVFVVALALASLAVLVATALANVDLSRNVTIVLTAILFCGAALHGLQIGTYTVVAHLYPTQCRAAGVGWSVSAGRVGGIVSSFVAGALLVDYGAAGFFGGVALMLVVALTAILLLRGHVAAGAIRE